MKKPIYSKKFLDSLDSKDLNELLIAAKQKADEQIAAKTPLDPALQQVIKTGSRLLASRGIV